MRNFIIFFLIVSLNAHAQTNFALLNGSASTNASTYRWKQIGGAISIMRTPDSVVCKVDSLKAGNLMFELTCTNQFGANKDSVMVTVLPSNYSVSITSALYKITSLVWTVTGEKGVLYYWLRKTRDGGKTYTKVTYYYARGGIKYTYYMSRTVFTYSYIITPVFNNLKNGTTVPFK